MYRANLPNHFKCAHRKEKRVAFALKQKPEIQREIFEKLKNEGMEKTNKLECIKKNPIFERKRKRNQNCNERLKSVMCSKCKVVLLQKNMSRHKRKCNESSDIRAVDMRSLTMDGTISDDFKVNVIGTFINDKISRVCKEDEGILSIGMVRYDRLKQNKDKAMEIRRSVRNDMRRLANLYEHFKKCDPASVQYSSSVDMFNKANFQALKKAINNYCKDGDKIKAGLKVSLKFLINVSAKILEGIFFSEQNDEEALVVSSFLSVFQLWGNQLFGDAYYQLNKNRLRKNRKPNELPLKRDMDKLRSFTKGQIQDITNQKNSNFLQSNEFVNLRNCVCARLTLFNARRGGEAARMLISEFAEAREDEWINKQQPNLDALDQKLVKETKMAYIMGKGSKSLVPLLIPKDVWPAILLLVSSENREFVGVSSKNPYVFAPIKTSNVENHISGWHAIDSICSKLELQSRSRITATKNRHYVSTIYSTLDLPEKEHEFFFKHMGHSKATNEQNYQCPPGLMEIIKVGKMLTNIDAGQYFYEKV